MKQYITIVALSLSLAIVTAASAAGRNMVLLSDAPWEFVAANSEDALPAIDSADFAKSAWKSVQVPHVFQNRQSFREPTQAWYRRDFTVGPELADKQLYLVFEGAATIADVFVNGKSLGQHRGAYTRFVFNATKAVNNGAKNQLAVRVDNDPKNTTDCLPDHTFNYKIWGGLYRKVWLVAVPPLHVELEDYASPGIYITPKNVSSDSATLSLQVLLKNSASSPQAAEVRATLLDPSNAPVRVFTARRTVPAGERATVEFTGTVSRPSLWEPATPNLYHVKVEVLRNGLVLDEVTQPTGFRNLVFEPRNTQVKLNGKPIVFAGTNLHQEIESKASAMSDDDFRANYDLMRDLGINFIRLPHYPHASLEYDLCDRLGIFCWAENGNSNREDIPGPTADRITTEMVKQNYNHPSIAMWSVGNEAGHHEEMGSYVADREVPIVKALDTSRPVVDAHMRSANADFVCLNYYPGWYIADPWGFKERRYVSENGAGGVTTIHCDYSAASFIKDKYEPEEYQQLVAEARFQLYLREKKGEVGIYAWWTMRDFTDVKYKGSHGLGWNSKGLLTYAGDKKDVYYLYRCFLRPNEPTVHITSQRYFLRTGAADNGIKVYSNAPKLTLALNGETVSTLTNGSYMQAGGHRVDNVFFWKTQLHTGRNTVAVSDNAGYTDSAVIYFYGANGLPEVPVHPLVTELTTSGTSSRAYFMDMPVKDQWPIYYDLDGTADNSFDRLPEEIEGAKWIAMRRVTKAGQETGLNFKVTHAATVFVMATRHPQSPSFLAEAGFKEVPRPGIVWRDNNLMLVPAQLFSRKAVAGEVVHLNKSDRDEIVLVKE